MIKHRTTASRPVIKCVRTVNARTFVTSAGSIPRRCTDQPVSHSVKMSTADVYLPGWYFSPSIRAVGGRRCRAVMRLVGLPGRRGRRRPPNLTAVAFDEIGSHWVGGWRVESIDTCCRLRQITHDNRHRRGRPWLAADTAAYGPHSPRRSAELVLIDMDLWKVEER